MDTLEKGMIYVRSGMVQDGMILIYTTQNDMQFKSYKLFISRIFHLIILDHGWLWVLNQRKQNHR